MKENVSIILDVDVNEAEYALETVLEGFVALKNLAQEMGAAMAKVFTPLQESLQRTEISIYTMTDALVGATSSLQELIALWDGELSLLGETSGAALEAVVGVVVGWIAKKIGPLIIPALQKAIGVLAAIKPEVAAIIAVVAVVVAAVVAGIVAIVKHWDEIKLFFTQTLPQLWEQFVQWISGIAGAVGEFFSGAMAAIGGFFADCWNGVVAVWNGAAQWMQDNIIAPIIAFFTPIVEWFASLFASIWQTVSDVFYNIGVIISGCWEIIKAVWAVVGSWFNDNVIQPVVGFFTGLWTNISTFAVQAWEGIKGAFSAVGNWFYQNVIQPVAGFFSGLWSGFLNAASAAWDGVKGVFSVVGKFFGDIFSKAWQGVVKAFSAAGSIFVDIKDAIVSVFKTVVNGIIKGLNSVIAVPFNGINSALKFVKNIEILGLQPFSGLKTISVPQIPLLAQGAVLPANKPFLAMVGDQRHGTNIEAPLATIQEAVALVMEDQTAAILSGFEASVGVQRAILEAVLGIQIGDEVIGQAVTRYNRKLAVMRGGV